jgi:alkylhydroperoxidase family enzyme
MGGHSQFLVKEFGMTQDEVERARRGEAVEGLTEQQHALIRFARRVAERPRQVSEEDIAALYAVGLDDAAIVEALSICMMSAWTNTLADTLKLDQDLEALNMQEGYF